MKQDTVLPDFTALKKYFSKRANVAAVYLYGSHATNTASRLSDIDMAVLFKKDPVDITRARIDLIVKITRLLNTDNVDVQILHQDMSLPLAQQILKYGKVLVDNDPDTRIKFENKLRNLIFDFEPYEEQIFQAMYERLEKGTYGYK